MKSNIIYINGRFLTQPMTGVQRVATEVGLLLQKHYGNRLVFLCPSEKLINPYAQEFNCKHFGKLKGHLWEQIELPFYFKIKRGEILVNFCNTAPIFCSKNLIVIHDMAIKQDKKWFDWKFVFVYNFLFYFNIENAKKIITDSNFSKDEIVKYYPKTLSNKITVIYLASFLQSKENTNDIKQNYFLAVNSISSRKNIKTITDAFEILDPKIYKLKVIGGTDKKVFGEIFNTTNENVEYLGNIPDEELYNVMIQAKALINASLYEGFGLPPLEAMSIKTPCILSDIPVYKELYGDVALFFEPTNPTELAQQIIKLYSSNSYKSLCEKSFEKSLGFSWNKVAESYINEIEKIITVK